MIEIDADMAATMLRALGVAEHENQIDLSPGLPAWHLVRKLKEAFPELEFYFPEI